MQWAKKTEIALCTLILWLGICRSKFYLWQQHYGKVREQDRWIPRDHWITPEERQAIIDYARKHPGVGYRRLTFMMMDEDIVAVSPATVYRVLKQEGLLSRPSPANPRRGNGFQQPSEPHQNWHIDFTHVKVAGTFYHMCSVIDGYSRYTVAWELFPTMRSADAQIVVQKAREAFPDARPTIISDNGRQFVCREFHQFISLCQFHHITTSPYYPQSNGKIERSFGSLKRECLRPQTPLTVEDARRVIQNYVNEYNHTRLHAAIGYVAPADRLHGLDAIIHQKRDEKLQEARELRRQRRQAAQQATMRQDNRIDFALLRRTVRMANVLEALVGLEHYRGSGPQRRGPCPIHQHPDGKNHRSFSVNLQRGIFRCFHPQCQCQGNVLDLWATCHNLDLPAAARSLAERFAPALISPDNTPTTEKRNPSS
ncbi:MAG: hypothetical protein KatS3mg109_0297 [Pirellulaceae bacterium]|nr:MAG: hypothetical protein KatS3mg109_0297 [Pirellulaceae bacterium]GIW93852.1 MAG: hypothetical protein KatS3mg110_1893 [Pirellulaceae bacterium]GIW95938.1 MAG: hypothetical protein KatS3mg110_3979 [Pirellulaceae bacterium]